VSAGVPSADLVARLIGGPGRLFATGDPIVVKPGGRADCQEPVIGAQHGLDHNLRLPDGTVFRPPATVQIKMPSFRA